MPYVAQETRKKAGKTAQGASAGEVNYLITNILDGWLKSNGVTYQNINAAIGVLECAKLELYRRVAAPYEDKKLTKNGEVYKCLEAK